MKAVLTILAGPIRCDLLLALTAGPACVGALATRLRQSMEQVSHALRSLHEAGMVEYSVESRRHVYRLSRRVRVSRDDDGSTISIDPCAGARITIEASLADLECLDGRAANRDFYRRISRSDWSAGSHAVQS